MMDTDVLIVGAGPVGLALAIELASGGQRCVVVERHDRVGYAPRAKTTNVRTRELFRRWGIADRLAEQSPFGVDYPSHVVFATRLAGYELARFSNAFNCNPARDERYAEHAQWIPQYRVEEVLRARAAELSGVQIRFNTELESFREDPDGRLTATLRTQGVGVGQVRARYLVGADGARSTVRHELGIRMEGVSPLSQNYNIIFRAPGLEQQHQLGPAAMYWLLNPEVPAVACPMDSDGKWSFGCRALADASRDPADLIRRAMGLDIEPEILSRDEWVAHQLIATSYRQGNVFLAGDACHLHPPFGGYGMNMGIGDALDLGWKLCAVLGGWGGPRLLDSYEAERRQVHRRVIDEAVANHASGVAELSMADIEKAGSQGDAVRRQVAANILSHKHREFHSLNVVLGCGYAASPILPRDTSGMTTLPPYDEDVARVGYRAPHLWLGEGTAVGESLFDHFDKHGYTLLIVDPLADEDARQILQAARLFGLPLHALTPNAALLAQKYDTRLVLIRPDQHVAWRGNEAAQAIAVLPLIAGRDKADGQ